MKVILVAGLDLVFDVVLVTVHLPAFFADVMRPAPLTLHTPLDFHFTFVERSVGAGMTLFAATDEDLFRNRTGFTGSDGSDDVVSPAWAVTTNWYG